VAGAKPILWHIPLSHYSEKVRWALALKGVEHARRAPPPPLHMAVALALTHGRSNTFPVLELNGKRIGDSTAIVAALERHFPRPALLPADPAQRERALALESFFDEELGPHIRLLAWHEILRDEERLSEVIASMSAGPLALGGGAASAAARFFVDLRYGVKSEEAARAARTAVLGALDRLEAELARDSEYLVGDSFTVADLTAAALFYPLVLPPEGPRNLSEPPKGLVRFRADLEDRRGYRWVESVYRRHRRASPA
jgi:glutathione S-transferase